MILHKRRGVALITVVLIAALLLISIAGISAKVITEKKVSNARSSSERALVAAETGLSQFAFDVRNTHFESDPPAIDPPDPFHHYLKIEEVEKIPRLLIGPIMSFSKGNYLYSSGPPYIRYNIKIKKISGYVDPLWTPDTVIDLDNPINIRVYVLGTVYKDFSTSPLSVLARRVVSADYEIQFSQGTEPVVFGYALFSGGNIGFGGSSNSTIEGDIFANGKISFNGTTDLDGTIHACDTVKFEPTSGDYKILDAQDEIPFPQLDVDYYKDLALKFKTGQPPYNGTVITITDPDTGEVVYTYTYPDTTNPIVQGVIQSYLGSDDTGNTVDEIQTFYSDLMAAAGTADGSGSGFNALNPTVIADLQTNAKSIVYFIDGNATIQEDFYCEGVIVVSGSLIVTGNSSVNRGVSSPNLAVLVKGDIEINDVAILNGLIYTEGHLNINGNASLECTGSLVSKYNISLNNITNVTYVDIHLPNTSITGAAEITTAKQTASSWKEVSYEEFENPPTTP